MVKESQKVWFQRDGVKPGAIWVFWYPDNKTVNGVRRRAFDNIKSAREWWESHGCELMNPIWGSE